MHEILKDIQNYESIYKISNQGTVYKCLKHGKLKKMRTVFSRTGYEKLLLTKNHESKTFYVHRLVATAFLENPMNFPQVNHIDGDKRNNNSKNLEWVTASMNQKHAIRNNLRTPSPNKGKFGKQNANSKRVVQYDLDGNFIKIWDSISDASRFLECKPCSISICANGRSRMSNGFQWRFFSAESFSEKIPSIKDKSGNTVVYNKRSYSHHVRKISQYSKSGQLINVWDNYKQLEKEGFSNGNIYKCLNGKYKSAYGYIWKYSD